MNFLLDNWILVLLVLSSGTMPFFPMLKGGGGLDANTVVMLMNREKAVVVDVCEPNEFAQGHIVGAKNVPLSQLEEKLASAAKNKALPLILVCQTGMRSGRALAVAKKLGYENVQSLAGGLAAWRTANLPIEKV